MTFQLCTLTPRMPHEWGYNVLPFFPSPNQNMLNFALDVFLRNVVQKTLSFDLEYMGRSFCQDCLCIRLNTFFLELGRKRQIADVNWLLCLYYSCSPGNKGGGENRKSVAHYNGKGQQVLKTPLEVEL